MIVDAIAIAVQAVGLAIKGAQAGAGGTLGPRGNGDNPFTKRLKAFPDIVVVKFSRDECPIAAIKWIIHTQKMVFILDSMLTEWVRTELIIH